MKLPVLIFTSLAVVLLLAITVDHSPRAFVTVDDSDLELYAGSEIITTEIQILRYENTKIKLNARTNFTIKSLKDEIVFFATRGHWIITPDREITSCTRKVCVTTSSPIQVRYYTPGEIVEIDTKGFATVSFQDLEYEITAGELIRIDELTGQTSIQSPSDGIETLSTP